MTGYDPGVVTDLAAVLRDRDDDVLAIAAFLPPKRRTLFLESIEVVRASVEQGSWIRRGAITFAKGFKALVSPKQARSHRDKMFNAYMAIVYGSLRAPDETELSNDDLEAITTKAPLPVLRAWLRLAVALRSICEDLDASRPAPVYTEIGISPKVTKTLLDATIGLDLKSRRLCPIAWRWVFAVDQDGKPTTRRVKIYYPRWPAGTVFGSSRFSGSDCEACGKSIPSGAVVPVLISDTAGAVHGFWFGRDCAANILGIKDAGISMSNTEQTGEG